MSVLIWTQLSTRPTNKTESNSNYFSWILFCIISQMSLLVFTKKFWYGGSILFARFISQNLVVSLKIITSNYMLMGWSEIMGLCCWADICIWKLQTSSFTTQIMGVLTVLNHFARNISSQIYIWVACEPQLN